MLHITAHSRIYQLFGCSPRFFTPLHPEGNSLVEKRNQTVKKMLHHVCQKNPRKWHKVLPLVLWTIRESKYETLGTSPHVMVFARTPSNPLKLIKESWTNEIDLPLGTAKSVSEYLTDLCAKLCEIHECAEDHATQEQEKYVAYYNRRAREKKMEIGKQVIVLLPDSSNKFLSRWQGPGLVVDFKPPHSYLVELEGEQRRWLHANKLRHYHARVQPTLVGNCAIVYESDEDFGTLPALSTSNVETDLPSTKVDFTKLSHLSTDEKHQFLSASLYFSKRGAY